VEKRILRRSLSTTFVLASVLIVTSLCVVSIGGASDSRASKRVTLQSVVISRVSGFVSEVIDKVGGGPTGRIGFSETESADCNPAALVRGQWTGSVLRYFDSNRQMPETYEILCVTQLRTGSEATTDRNHVTATIGSGISRLRGSESIYSHSVGPTEQLYFAKGPYFVWVVATSLSSVSRAAPIATLLARRQYALLPT